jgi:cofilin
MNGTGEPSPCPVAPASAPPSPPPAPAAAAAPGALPKLLVAPAGALPAPELPAIPGARPKGAAAAGGGVSMSGIAVTDPAINLFYAIKAKSAFGWATWRINPAGSAVVGDVVADGSSPAGSPAAWAGLLASLPANDCRYAVYDYTHVNSEGRTFQKLIFINWAPDTAKVKHKMMYASTKDHFKGHLDGLGVELQASDLGDLAEADVAEAVRASVTRQ